MVQDPWSIQSRTAWHAERLFHGGRGRQEYKSNKFTTSPNQIATLAFRRFSPSRRVEEEKGSFQRRHRKFITHREVRLEDRRVGVFETTAVIESAHAKPGSYLPIKACDQPLRGLVVEQSNKVRLAGDPYTLPGIRPPCVCPHSQAMPPAYYWPFRSHDEEVPKNPPGHHGPDRLRTPSPRAPGYPLLRIVASRA